MQHAGDDYIVRSLRENAIIAHKPSVGLQDPVLKFDYSGAPRERSMPSSIGDVHDSGVDSRRHNMHRRPLSGPVERQGMMVSLAAAHPSATSKVARARQGLQERALRRATRHATGVLPRNQLEIIGDGVRSFLNRATGALVAAAIHFPSGKVEKAVQSAGRGNRTDTPPTGRSGHCIDREAQALRRRPRRDISAPARPPKSPPLRKMP